MGKLTIKILSVFGRYSVLFLLPPVALLFWGWLLLIEDYGRLALILVLPVLLVVLAAVVLVLGILLARVRSPVGITVDRAAAPALWDYWDRASPAGVTVRRQIIIDSQINASMAENLRFAGLIGRDQTLILGLGLLIVLDTPAVEAVLEHEFAHAELEHSSGLTRIHEFLMTYEAFDGYIEHEMPILDMFLGAAFSHFAGWLWKEYRRHSKIYELQADRQSADRVGLETEARAQLLLEGSTRTAQNLIFDPLEKEILGALTAPMPPLDRILAERAELTSLENISKAVSEVLLEDDDPDATHPPLAERLVAIGATPDMAIKPVGPPAFETMLPEETRERLLHDLNDEWIRIVDEHVRLQ